MNNENEMPQTTGVCKYCGQRKLIQTVGEITQAQADEIVTSECDCPDAKKMKNRKSKITKANEWAELRFERTPEVIALFQEVFRSVTNNEVEKVSIKANEWTHNVFLDSDGYLTVKSSKKVDEEESFA